MFFSFSFVIMSSGFSSSSVLLVVLFVVMLHLILKELEGSEKLLEGRRALNFWSICGVWFRIFVLMSRRTLRGSSRL